MFIKLLCIETVDLLNEYGSTQFRINEGDIVTAIVNGDGVSFENKEDKEGYFSAPYHYEDVREYFISAFDQEAFNKKYREVSNCKMYFEDGKVIKLDDALITMQNSRRLKFDEV